MGLGTVTAEDPGSIPRAGKRKSCKLCCAAQLKIIVIIAVLIPGVILR